MLDTRRVLADNLRVIESISIGDLNVAIMKGVHVHHGLATPMEATAPRNFRQHHIKPAPIRGAVMRRRL